MPDGLPGRFLFHAPVSWGLGGYRRALGADLRGGSLQATRRDTWASASLRVLGTFIGAVASAIYLSFLPFNPFGMAAVIGVVILLCQVLGIPDHARLASIVVAVIMVFSSFHQEVSPLLNATLRFVESFIGTSLAVVAVLLWSKPD